MFETADEAEIPIPDAFRADGERAWSYVLFRLHVPWFHVVYELPLEHGGSLRCPIFFTDVYQLIRLTTDDVKLAEVQVVLPGHLTGQDRWAMEPVVEIWEGIAPGPSELKTYVYVLANGKRYLSSGPDENEADLLDRQLVFKADQHKGKRRRKP